MVGGVYGISLSIHTNVFGRMGPGLSEEDQSICLLFR